MSRIGTVIDAILTVAESAITGLTTSREAKNPDVLSPDQLPFLMAVNPLFEPDRLEHGQNDRVLTVPLLLVQRDTTQEQTLLDLDAFEDALLADRTLGGIVRDTEMDTAEIGQEVADDPRIFTAMSVLTRRVL